MPKCPKCGKKFSTLQALNDHFKKVHPNEKFVAPKQASSARNLIAIIVVVIIVMGSIVGYLIYTQVSPGNGTTTGLASMIGDQAPAPLLQNITGVSTSTLEAIGSQPTSIVTPPSSISGAALTVNGKPEVLYIGAEFCPYCAAERWAMIMALSKFGTFSNITLMLSSSSDIYANTPTFSFVNASYTSSYISFVSVESQDRNHNSLQPISPSEQTLLTDYDPVTSACTTGGCIPFIDMGNNYTVVGAQYVPTALRVGDTATGAPYNWTQVGSMLNNPDSVVAKSIDGTANTLVTAICNMLASYKTSSPSSVCSQSFADVTLASPSGSSGPSPLQVSSVLPSRLHGIL